MEEVVSNKTEQKETDNNIDSKERTVESSKQTISNPNNNQKEVVPKRKKPENFVHNKPHTKKAKKKMSKKKINNTNSIKHAMYSELRAEYCNDCHINQKCPRWQPNSLCAYSDVLKRYPKWEKFKKNPDVIIKRIYTEVQDQIRILEKNKFSNRKQGDKLNKDIETVRKDMIANLKLMHDMSTGGEKLKVKVESNPVDKIFAEVMKKRKHRQEAKQDGKKETRE